MKAMPITALQLSHQYVGRSRRQHRPALNGGLYRTVALCAVLIFMACVCPIIARADCIPPIALWKLDEEGAHPVFHDAVNPGSNSGICRQEDSVTLCPNLG